MRRARSVMEQMQATIDNQRLDIMALKRQIGELKRNLEAANNRNQDLKDLAGMQASALVQKDRMIMILQREIAK